MGETSYLSQAQQAADALRRREGRPDKAAMTNEERRAAGLMDRGEAARHERLATLPHERLAERIRGRLPDDIWTLPDLDGLGRAWNAASTTALADQADDFALCAAVAAGCRLADALGHGDCGGILYDAVTPLTCACGTVLSEPKAAAA